MRRAAERLGIEWSLPPLAISFAAPRAGRGRHRRRRTDRLTADCRASPYGPADAGPTVAHMCRITCREFGPPDQLTLEEAPDRAPGPAGDGPVRAARPARRSAGSWWSVDQGLHPRLPLNRVLLDNRSIVGVTGASGHGRIGANRALITDVLTGSRGELHPVAPESYPLERAGGADRPGPAVRSSANWLCCRDLGTRFSPRPLLAPLARPPRTACCPAEPRAQGRFVARQPLLVGPGKPCSFSHRTSRRTGGPPAPGTRSSSPGATDASGQAGG